jgi:hypothetical protein
MQIPRWARDDKFLKMLPYCANLKKLSVADLRYRLY